MTSWHELLEEASEEDGESALDLVCTLTPEEMDAEFKVGEGCIQGLPFTAWGKDWVYFPIKYDGQEWVGRAPRNPCDTSMEHQGG